MKIIKCIIEYLNDEIDGADEYIKKAVEVKEDYPSLAKTLFEMSNEELRHVDLLHNEVAKLISEYRRENGEPPEAMLAVYNYEHEKEIDHVAKIKALQSMFNSR